MGSLRVWRCASSGGIVLAALAIAVACGEALAGPDDATDPPVRDSGSSTPDAPASDGDPPPIEECKDTTSQSDHCGACDRSCFGGQCLKGVCAPALLADKTTTPLGIAVDATHVYWTSNANPGSIQRIAKATRGAGTPETFASNTKEPVGVAVNATTVYWTTASTLNRRPKDRSTEATATTPPFTALGIWWITADDAKVYFSSQSGPGLGVIKANADYTSPVKVSDVSSIAFAVDDDIAYSAGAAQTAIYVGDGGASASTASTYDTVRWIALGPNDVWWTHRFGLGHVARAGLSGADAGSFDGGSPDPGGIVYDAQRQHPFYVTATQLMRLEDLETPVAIATIACPNTPGQLAQDDDALYWTCPDANQVWRWTKPPVK